MDRWIVCRNKLHCEFTVIYNIDCHCFIDCVWYVPNLQEMLWMLSFTNTIPILQYHWICHLIWIIKSLHLVVLLRCRKNERSKWWIIDWSWYWILVIIPCFFVVDGLRFHWCCLLITTKTTQSFSLIDFYFSFFFFSFHWTQQQQQKTKQKKEENEMKLFSILFNDFI